MNITNRESLPSSQEKSCHYKSLHHSFDIDLATLYGVHEAILIHHFQHWISINQRAKRHFYEGRYWTYQTIEDIALNFPYFSRKQVERLLNKLCSDNILIKGNFNKTKFDRTVWYAFQNEERYISQELHIPKSGNGKPEIGTPIPDTIPDTKTEESTSKDVPKKVGVDTPLASNEAQPHIPKNIVKKNRKGLQPVRSNIFLTETEKAKLLEKLGQDKLNDILDNMELYQDANNKYYQNHYAGICKWIRNQSNARPSGNCSNNILPGAKWTPPNPETIVEI